MSFLCKAKNKILNDDRLIFYVVCIIFVIILCFVNRALDDTGGLYQQNGTLRTYAYQAYTMYFTWQPRVLANFFILIFTDHANVWWAICMGITLYVLLYSLSTLFVKDNKKICNIFIASLVMLYPWQDLYTAGWVTTMTTYFTPIAFGFLSLIPIKKIAENKKLRWWEYIIYSLAIFYAADLEQMMAVLLAAYLVAGIYFLVKNKRIHVFVITQFVLVLIRAVLVIVCPGTDIRNAEEIITWFPTYGMLDKIDKTELGYSTTMQWLFFSGVVCIIVICVLFAYLICKRYKSKALRFISVLPAAFVIMTGPLNHALVSMFPSLEALAADIPYYGLVNASNRGSFAVFSKYAVFGILIICVLITIIMMQTCLKDLIIALVLILAGVATRVIIGFSPTIYASLDRTCAVLLFCIIAVACMVFSRSISSGLIDKKGSSRIMYIMLLLMVFGFANLALRVGTAFA